MVHILVQNSKDYRDKPFCRINAIDNWLNNASNASRDWNEVMRGKHF